MAKKSLFEYISPNKWYQRLSIVVIGLIMGFVLALVAKPTSLGFIPNALLLGFISMYMLYLTFGGLIKEINAILSPRWKKIASYKVFLGWFLSLYGWLIIGGLIFAESKSKLFAQIWVYSIFGLIVVYPCIISLAVYIPSYQYLRDPENEVEVKKTVINSLNFLTISLATPWILMLLLFYYITIPIWANFLVVVTVYATIFILAIDLPYYLSMEDVKKAKINALRLTREKLVEVCDSKKATMGELIEILKKLSLNHHNLTYS